MAQQPNAGEPGANGEAPQVNNAAVGAAHNRAARLPQMDGPRVLAAGPAAAPAPVAGPPVADAVVPRFPPGLGLHVDAALLGPMPRKSNGSYKLLPKIASETGP